MHGELMLALYRSGRQADALESYRNARRSLVEERGLEPGPALQELERAILAHDPALGPPTRASTRRPAAVAGRTRRGGLLIAAAGVILLAALVAAAVKLASGALRGPAPREFAGDDRPADQHRGGVGPGGEPARPGRVWCRVAVGRQPG